MDKGPNQQLSGEAQLKYENDRLKLALAQRWDQINRNFFLKTFDIVTIDLQLCKCKEVGGGACDVEEQQRAADVGAAGVDGERGGVEAAAALVQGGEHAAQGGPHRARGRPR